VSYEQFGDDAAALLQALKVEGADVMGYSQGGGVALQLALRHPTLVNKLVSLSATYRKDVARYLGASWPPHTRTETASAEATVRVHPGLAGIPPHYGDPHRRGTLSNKQAGRLDSRDKVIDPVECCVDLGCAFSQLFVYARLCAVLHIALHS
jgi:pimeloyl-ACP methyl ester carboxylesterase